VCVCVCVCNRYPEYDLCKFHLINRVVAENIAIIQSLKVIRIYVEYGVCKFLFRSNHILCAGRQTQTHTGRHTEVITVPAPPAGA